MSKLSTPRKSKEPVQKKPTPKKTPSKEKEDGSRCKTSQCSMSKELHLFEKKEKQPPSSQQPSSQQSSSQQPSTRSDRQEKCKKKATLPPPPPKVQPRRIPSFGQTKPVKTTKDIKEELQGQRSKAVIKNLLVGVDGNEYDMFKEIFKSKKGSIFRVMDRRPGFDDELVAKTKHVTNESIHNEIRFLLEFQQTLRDNWNGSDHFLPICSYGSAGDLAWFVQPRCGPNIDQMRKEMNEEFSPQTAVRIGLMVLEAISCLHRCEVIHGRLEPSHVVIGSGTLQSCVYLVGLGHIHEANQLPATFTWSRLPAYAPRRVPRDPYVTELETWFYLLLDLYGRNHLPWKKDNSLEKAQRYKEQIIMFPMLLQDNFPLIFQDLAHTLATGDGYNDNMARVLRRRLTDYMKEEKISRHKPFEWEKTSKDVNTVERIKEYNRMTAIIRDAANNALDECVDNDGDD